MGNDVATIQARLPMPSGVGDDMDARKWRVLCESVFPAAKTAEAIVMALDYCKARKLDPFKRPVNIVPMWNKSLGREVETVWPGINEVQVTASRTGKYAGMDEPKWGDIKTQTFKGLTKWKEGSQWKEENLEVTIDYPEWCSVTVYRIVEGQRCAFTEPVFWLEAYAHRGKTEVPNDMWAKRARGQLLKVAKAFSLRAAFPEEGEYTSEEMEGKEIIAGGVVIENEKPEPKSIFKNASLRNKWFDNVNGSFVAAESVEALKELASLNKAKFDEIEANGHEHDLLAVEELRKRYSAAYTALVTTQTPAEDVYDEEPADLDPRGEFEMPTFLGEKHV